MITIAKVTDACGGTSTIPNKACLRARVVDVGTEVKYQKAGQERSVAEVVLADHTGCVMANVYAGATRFANDKTVFLSNFMTNRDGSIGKYLFTHKRVWN
jgi:RPA family protein